LTTTGSGTITGTVTVTPNVTYATGYNPGVTVVASGSTSTITSTATLLQELHLNNIAAAAVTVSVTDGNNVFIVGPNYSIPALSNLQLNFGVGILAAGGIKASAGTANSINMFVGGRQ